MKRIGIDVGGTNTDAVLIDGDTIVASIKVPTTQDVLSGVKAALSPMWRAMSARLTGRLMR